LAYIRCVLADTQVLTHEGWKPSEEVQPGDATIGYNPDTCRSEWTVKRGAVGTFFRGTTQDPDPLLVVTTEAVVEYVSSKKPLAVVLFADLASVTLRAQATTTSNSMTAWLQVWLDLRYADGREDQVAARDVQGRPECHPAVP
jgi:hypothetical protein